MTAALDLKGLNMFEKTSHLNIWLKEHFPQYRIEYSFSADYTETTFRLLCSGTVILARKAVKGFDPCTLLSAV